MLNDVVASPLDYFYPGPTMLFLVFAVLFLVNLVVSIILFISFAKKKKAVKLVFAIITAVFSVSYVLGGLILLMGL